MLQRNLIAVVAIAFSIACNEVQVPAQAALEGMKVKSVSLQGDERERVANDFVATAVMGELFKRGAVASEDGLEITGRVEWSVSTLQSSYYGVRITAAVFDPQGISFSVAVDDKVPSFGPHSYVRLAQSVADQFGRALNEQINSQRDRGRAATIKPQESPVSDPDKATSRVGLPDVSSLPAPTEPVR